MRGTRFYQAAEHLFKDLGMPDVPLEPRSRYTVVVDSHIHVDVFANADDDRFFLAVECGQLPSSPSVEQLIGLLQCNADAPGAPPVTVGVRGASGMMVVCGCERLAHGGNADIKLIFDATVSKAERVLSMLAMG